MPLSTQQKLAILHDNPNAIAVYDQRLKKGLPTVVLCTMNIGSQSLMLPKNVHPDDVEIKIHPQFTDLRLPLALANTVCYHEPVPGGVQIQPQKAPWVGTLGAAVRFDTLQGHRRYGILSNWHVMCPDQTQHGHPIHQPQDNRPAIALLEDWLPVDPNNLNLFDAAVADAKIDGLHTVKPEINQIGLIHPEQTAPNVDMDVQKCGRTTGLTFAKCIATGAAVEVEYDTMIATFIDQAIFQSLETPFSQPGDSGSLIITQLDRRPCALLFAGSDELTIGSPLKPICDRFHLSFHFPET